MKWTRFISFILIFCIIFGVLNTLQGNQATVRWDNYYKLPPNSLDIIYVGNSHNFNALNPKIVDDILNINSYVIGNPGENIVVSYYELKEALKSQTPRAVMVETYVLDLLPDDMLEHGYLYRFLDAGGWSANKIQLTAKFLFPDRLAGIFPIFRQRMEWEKPYIYFTNLKTMIKEFNNPSLETDTGARIHPNVISSTEYEQAISSQDPDFIDPPMENLAYLEKFITLCNQNNITPLFNTAPILQIPKRTYDVYAPMNRDVLAKDYGLNILDFNQYGFNQLHFVNPDHVNAFGSLIISTETAVNLSKRLGIPLDQKILDYYRTYYFDKFDISQSDKEAILTLYPSNPDTPLLYAWEISKDDIILLKTDYQSQNSITFPTSEAGEYQIRVEIWNPDGNFVLEGLFTHIVEE